MYISSEPSTDDQSLVDCHCYCIYLIPTILQDRTIIVIIFESPRSVSRESDDDGTALIR